MNDADSFAMVSLMSCVIDNKGYYRISSSRREECMNSISLGIDPALVLVQPLSGEGCDALVVLATQNQIEQITNLTLGGGYIPQIEEIQEILEGK
jgi:hypothetical protein